MRGFGQLVFLAAGQAISLAGLPAKYYPTRLTKNGFFDVQASHWARFARMPLLT